jgi:recombination protein RecA
MPRAKTTTAPPSDSKAGAEKIISEINAEYGADTVLWGSQLKYLEVPRISSGSLSLDVALGGGWTVNSWNEIYGDESSGKTTLILKTIATQQEIDKDWTVFWVAAEEFVPEWARLLGCDTDRIIVMQTNVFEEATNAAIKVLESRTVDCLVIDSLPALSPATEGDGSMDDQQMGLVARLLGKFFRKAYTAMKRSLVEFDRPITCFMVNQWRERIGIMFGDPRTTPGGRAKNYWYFTRVELKRDEWITEGEKRNQRKVGISIRALTKKNKGFPPERLASFDFYFDHNEAGISRGSYDPGKELIDLALYFGLLKVGGGHYRLDELTWHGRAALEDQVKWDLTLRERMRDTVMSCVVKGRRLDDASSVVEEPKRILRRGQAK